MSKFLNYLRNHLISVIVILLILAGVGSYFAFFRAKKDVLEVVLARRGDLIQEVSVTGRVKPARAVDLAFEKSGKVLRVYSEVGDRIRTGDLIVSLESGDLLADLEGARANLQAEEAKLQQIQSGTRPEEIRVQEEKVRSAESALADAKEGFVDDLKDAYTKSDDAVRNKVYQFVTNPKSQNPQLNYTGNSQLQLDIQNEILLLEDMFDEWRGSLAEISNFSLLSAKRVEAERNLARVKIFLEKVSAWLSSLNVSTGLTQTVLDGYKSDVSTGRTNINTAASNITSGAEKIKSADSALSVARSELDLKKAGSRPEEISAQAAKVRSALSSVSGIEADLAKNSIRSPINGIVTKQEAKSGEVAQTNAIIVSVISDAKYQIESQVPEADIAKLHVGDEASVTLDAYSSDTVFKAKIVKIDPAEVIVEGVPTYKTILEFSDSSDLIKSGMTANADILAAKKENVLFIPERALIEKDSKKFIKIKKGEEVIETEVTSGFRDSFGNIEILNGATEGDLIVIFEG